MIRISSSDVYPWSSQFDLGPDARKYAALMAIQIAQHFQPCLLRARETLRDFARCPDGCIAAHRGWDCPSRSGRAPASNETRSRHLPNSPGASAPAPAIRLPRRRAQITRRLEDSFVQCGQCDTHHDGGEAHGKRDVGEHDGQHDRLTRCFPQ